MERPEIGTLVLVEWGDIHTDLGWESLTHEPGVAPCKTVGFVTHSSEKHLSLAASMGVDSVKDHTNTETNLRQSIPWGCVTGWVRLVPRRGAK